VNQYAKQRKLGAGSYSKVVLYRSREDGGLYALKVLSRAALSRRHVARGAPHHTPQEEEEEEEQEEEPAEEEEEYTPQWRSSKARVLPHTPSHSTLAGGECEGGRGSVRGACRVCEGLCVVPLAASVRECEGLYTHARTYVCVHSARGECEGV
jgi:serine/threonine protein kinase